MHIVGEMEDGKLNGRIKMRSDEIEVDGWYREGRKEGRWVMGKRNKGERMGYEGEFKGGK